MAEVRLEVDLAHPPERVWGALTEARLLGSWFMPTDLEPRAGGRFTLDPGGLAGFCGPVSGELTELVPPHRMVMLWQGDKLHTRVAWELTETDGGCRLDVLQTGFIGAPAALRRRALRDTYTRLFAEQLPALLDQLAAGGFDETGSLPAAVPRQRRRAGGNMPVVAWSAGRTLGAAAVGTATAEPGESVRPDGPDRDRPVLGDGRTGSGGGLAEPGAAGSPVAVVDPELADGTAPPGRGLPEAVPAWVRAAVIAAAVAVLAVVVLAAVVQTPPTGTGDLAAGPDGGPGDPGVALQPGAANSDTGPAGQLGGASPGAGPASSAGPLDRARGDPLPAEEPGAPGQPSQPGLPPSESVPSSQPLPGPELAASVSTSGLPLGLGGRGVTVTVSNPGPGTSTGWEVTMDVGDQQVTNVSGAGYARDGTVAIFTPLASELPGGESVEFSFDIPGLLGVANPTDCRIDGRPCD